MLREQHKFLTKVHQTLDILLVAAAFVSAYYVKKHYLPAGYTGVLAGPNYYFVMLLGLVSFHLSLNFFGIYESQRSVRFYGQGLKIFKGVGTGYVFLVLMLYLMKIEDISRIMMGLFFVHSMIFLVTSKAIINYSLRHFRKKDYNFRNVLIIGSKERARDLIRSIRTNPDAGYKILGCLDVDPKYIGAQVDQEVTIIGSLNDFFTILLNESVDEVVFALPLKNITEARKYISFAEEIGVNVRIMPDWQINQLMYQPETAKVFIDQFAGMPTVALSSTHRREIELFFKTAIDYTTAFFGLLVSAPLLLAISVLIKTTSKGPVFFKQERCGKNGRKFAMYKFRTMVNNAEQLKEELESANEMSGPVFKIKNDPRITPIGKFLRKTSLDELPQLFNIMKGEMSLVGPRPPIPSEVENYQPWQRRRLSMKPGITCVWQISAKRNDIDFEEWMALDLQYIDTWTLSSDLKLLFLTIRPVLFGSGR